MSEIDIDNGTQFDFTYAPGISSEQIIGFEMAGAIWSSYLQDNVTVRIYVESSDQLPENLVGAALPGKKKKVDYDKLWDEMSEDITSSDDSLAFNNLPSTDKEFSVLIDGVKLDKTKEFRISNANAKALDLLKDDRKKLDGYIVVNDLTGDSTVGWDYDALRNSSIQGNNLDFLSVALHEIGHVLGFVSGIDDSDWLEVLTESRDKEKEIKDKDFKFASPLDLYRYSDSSAAMGELDLSTGGNPFFSIDGGNTKLGNFANGEYTDFGGDGYQASHWQQNSSQGIMNPLLAMGDRKDISTLDIRAMDVIGWDINTSVSLDWENMYGDAVASSETAVIEDRTKDVEKMVKESKYDGRRSRGSSSGSSADYSWQLGLYSTFDSLNIPEGIVVIDEIEPDTDDDIDELENEIEPDTDDDVDEPDEPEITTQSEIGVFTDVENDEDNRIEDNDGLLTESDDDSLGVTGVSSDEQGEDSLLSGGLSEQTELDDALEESAILPDLVTAV